MTIVTVRSAGALDDAHAEPRERAAPSSLAPLTSIASIRTRLEDIRVRRRPMLALNTRPRPSVVCGAHQIAFLLDHQSSDRLLDLVGREIARERADQIAGARAVLTTVAARRNRARRAGRTCGPPNSRPPRTPARRRRIPGANRRTPLRKSAPRLCSHARRSRRLRATAFYRYGSPLCERLVWERHACGCGNNRQKAAAVRSHSRNEKPPACAPAPEREARDNEAGPTRPSLEKSKSSERRRSASPAAKSPADAAATATTATASRAAAKTAAASATAAATAAASALRAGRHFVAELRPRRVLLVEKVERRQADVGDLFLADRYLARRKIQRRIMCRRHCGRVSAACQRERRTGQAHQRHCRRPTRALGRLLGSRHREALPFSCVATLSIAHPARVDSE